MTCREFTEFLDRYLAGELSEAEQARFERHLGVCRDCRNYLSSYENVVALEGSALKPDDRLPEDVPEDLVAAIMATVQR
jgi:predicted anti-sigma-YlaC factor YlaD